MAAAQLSIHSARQALVRRNLRAPVKNLYGPVLSLPYQSRSSFSTNSNILGEKLTLPDGRDLGFHQYGDPHGTPVIYIHGTPDSGASMCGFEDALGKKLGIRWIGPDRPGIGKSTFQPDREVLDYPSDMMALVKHLGLTKYNILGVSGGTGYALACAQELPEDELVGVGICAGMGPWEGGLEGQSFKVQLQMHAFKTFPQMMSEAMEKNYVPLAQDPDPAKMEAQWRKDIVTVSDLERDRTALSTPSALRSATATFRQVYCQGVQAHQHDFKLNTKSWGFSMADIKRERIKFWYGSDDTNTSPEMGRYMARRLRRSVYKEYEGDTHYTLWNPDNLPFIIRDLLEER